MASAKKVRELQSDDTELEMTPMIDVVFLLLIFFMCTLKFKTLEGKLAAYLPKDVGVNPMDAEPIEKIEIMLRVRVEGNKLHPDLRPYTGTGRFIYDDTRQVEYSVGPKKTRNLDEIKRRLEQLRKADKDRPATIDARQGTIYADVVKVLDVALEVGFQDITFVGAYPDKNK